MTFVNNTLAISLNMCLIKQGGDYVPSNSHERWHDNGSVCWACMGVAHTWVMGCNQSVVMPHSVGGSSCGHPSNRSEEIEYM